MTRVYIALGSNLGLPEKNVALAIEALKKLPKSTFVSCSSLYRSIPMGHVSQNDYINAVVAINTKLDPLDLLDKTQEIEIAFGRAREEEERWGPRTLDLDILLYGHCNMKTERLTLPHYGMTSREFVLYPLDEIAPDLQLPDGRTLKSLLSTLTENGMTVISQA